jgi:hypothetical protein
MSKTTRDGKRSTEHERTRAPLAGGVLVYEQRGLGRELVGVEADPPGD